MKRFIPSIFTAVVPGLLVLAILLLLPQAALAANPAGNLDQIRNGSASSPVDPGAWVNGNLNSSQAHYIEGQVVPYRLTLTNLVIGTTYYIRIEWDVKHSGKNALDFITGYYQVPPKGISEAILPAAGVHSGSYDSMSVLIPTPTFLPTAPLASFTGSSSIFSAFNGTLGATIGYYETPDYTQSQTTAGVTLQVTATNSTCILAWGGHIASRLDWGYTNGVPNSAGGISGSPYHMRFIGMGTDGVTFTGGNQDRSLAAAAVFFPPQCILLNSSESVCAGATVTFRDSVVLGTGTSFTSSWTHLPSTTVIATTQNLTLTNVTAADAGTYQVIITDNDGFKDTCTATLTVGTPPTLSIVTDTITCTHTTASVTVTATPSTGATYLWTPAPLTGQGTATATYGDSGTVKVVVTSSEGCADSITAHILKNTTPPSLTIDCGSTLTCTNTSTTLTVTSNPSTGVTYLWKPAPVSGQGTASAVYADSGTKWVIVTVTATGCKDSISCHIEQNTTPPSLSIDCGSTLTCTNTSTTLTVTSNPSTGVTYLWKPAPVSGQGTASAVYADSGTKWVIVTVTATGCVDSISCHVGQDNSLPSLSISCDSLTCIHTVASLTVTSTPSTGVSYLWKPTPVSGQGTATATYTTPGTKWVIVTLDASGCKDSISCTVTQDTTKPRLQLVPDTITCIHTQATVCNDVVYSNVVAYLWSPAPVSGQGTSCAVYADSGWKKLIVTFTATGCMDSAMVYVPANTTKPGLTVQTDTITCAHPQATVCVSATPSTGVTYWWSPAPVSGQGTSCAVYADSGWKKVVVTITATGCKDSINAYVPANTTLPTMVFSDAGSIVCNSTGHTLSVTATPATGVTYLWSVIEGDWSITAGGTTNSITFDAGTTDSATFKVVVTITATGCVDSATVTLHCQAPPREFCTLTQGAYGNANGMFMGMRRTQLINYLIAKTGSLTVGKPGRSLTFLNGTASCIISRLPAGGPAAALPASLGNYTVGSCPTNAIIPLGSGGRFRNVLLGQTITLSLNVRLDTLLGNFVLCSQFMTQEHLTDTTFTVYNIPASVLTALQTLSLPNTVYGLLELANRALAGQNTAGASLSAINSAVDIINEAFDECRFVTSSCGVLAVSKNIHQFVPEKLIPTAYAVSANYPNPFNPTTSIDFELPQASQVQLVIFNILGQKVATLVEGQIEAGYHSIMWNATNNGGAVLPSGLYFYRFQATSVTTNQQFARTVKMLLMK